MVPITVTHDVTEHRDLSISRQRRIHFVGPGVDPALHVLELLEAEVLQHLHRLLAAGPVVAVHDDGIG